MAKKKKPGMSPPVSSQNNICPKCGGKAQQSKDHLYCPICGWNNKPQTRPRMIRAESVPIQTKASVAMIRTRQATHGRKACPFCRRGQHDKCMHGEKLKCECLICQPEGSD